MVPLEQRVALLGAPFDRLHAGNAGPGRPRPGTRRADKRVITRADDKQAHTRAVVLQCAALRWLLQAVVRAHDDAVNDVQDVVLA